MKTLSDPTVNTAGKIAETVTSLGKLLLQSRPVGKYPAAVKNKPLIILGNGPSLRNAIDNHSDILTSNPTLAVNFAANTPEFRQIKPTYYVLADPVFFNPEGNSQVRKLIESINTIDWEMTLFIPRKENFKTNNPNLKICRFNMVGIEGNSILEKYAFRHKLGMPRPRNVLIPSIMIGIWCGYKNIVICGADHSWTETLRVDKENRVVSIQPHFYAENEKETERISQVYSNVRLHHILHSFYVAFRAYHSIRQFADSNGIRILNATPDSFIDAFERKALEYINFYSRS